MTDERMALIELVEKQADTDLVREMLAFAADRIMELEVELRTGAVATSGTAARGQHITDPGTGAPATELLSATVVGPSLTWADVYATAAFVLGQRGLGWLATRQGHAGILIGHDGTVTTVKALPLGGGPAAP